MTRSILAALILTLGATAVSAQTAGKTTRPLIDWDISRWNPESQAACGAFLTKFGYTVVTEQKTDTVHRILYHGLALDGLSKRTDPETNDLAWDADVDRGPGQAGALLRACLKLSGDAMKRGIIPQDVLDIALDQANKIMRGEL